MRKSGRPQVVVLPDGNRAVQRFSRIRRLEHAWVIAAVLSLLLTGLPQKMYEMPWAISILRLCGGLSAVRAIHHAIGLLMVLELCLHVGFILFGVATRRMQLSLFPTPDDVRDLVHTWKYRFGFSSEVPRYAVFNYRQKFQYVGILLSGGILVLSGLVLLFPQAAVSLLPGHMIPAAREVHSSDGLLAFVLLVIWHVYGTILSPDAFPLNKSIFTGWITLDEMKKFHGRQYEALFGSPGEQESPPEPAK